MDFKTKVVLSIIVPTIGRRDQLRALLSSILNLKLNLPYEIIIIDQNPLGFIQDIIDYYHPLLKIKSVNVNFRGLSKAKNFGANIAVGEYICFPDDDCEFLNDTIDNAINYLRKHKVDILFGKCVDRYGIDSVLKFKKTQLDLNLNNMEGGFVEATIFSKKSVFEKFIYDETLGAGCFHGAEEGYDWLYRVLESKEYTVKFTPNVIFYHPSVSSNKKDPNSIRRVFSYRCGFAKLCTKHKLFKKYFKRLILVSVSLPFYLIFDKVKFRYYLAEFLGLIVGVVVK
jgi:glycosyltransferase involved in cell wall biosynthesis